MVQKTKIKRPSRRKRAYGGAIFASAVFIVLSMMVIKQNEELMQWEGLAKSWLGITGTRTALANHASTTLEEQIKSCLAENQVKDAQIAEKQQSEQVLINLVSITDVDERLLGLVRIFYENISTSSQVLVRRPSPSGKLIMVVYGDKTETHFIGHGYYVRQGAKLFSLPLSWTKDEIRNVRWINENTIAYEVFALDASGNRILKEKNSLPVQAESVF